MRIVVCLLSLISLTCAAAQFDIRKNVDLVLVRVNVIGTRTLLPVTGLQQGHFRVWDNKREQTVKYFSSEDAPCSIGIILDRSGSMKDKWEYVTEAVRQIADQSNPTDEIMMTTFADRIDMSPFTDITTTETARLPFENPQGRTSLIDAVYATVQRMQAEAKYSRRAVILISDGGDNYSRYTWHELKHVLQEADVPVYIIGIFEPQPPTEEEQEGPDLLYNIGDQSGGFGIVVQKMADLKAAGEYFGALLRYEYVLGFQPQELKRDHQYHRIKVELQRLPKGLPPLTVHSTNGYYGPND